MHERCSEFQGSCSGVDRVFEFTLNTGTGQGRMIQQGAEFDGTVEQSGDATHFIFVNSSGIEMGTIASTGEVIYSGNMQIGDNMAHYRLRGQCTQGGTAAPVDNK